MTGIPARFGSRRFCPRPARAFAPEGRCPEPALVREITAVSLRPASATVEPGSVVSFEPVVANASSGAEEIQIDRFDPLSGWHFNRLLRVAVGGSAQWRPPAEGRWRFRATFKGTLDASPSRSGYVQLEVKGD